MEAPSTTIHDQTHHEFVHRSAHGSLMDCWPRCKMGLIPHVNRQGVHLAPNIGNSMDFLKLALQNLYKYIYIYIEILVWDCFQWQPLENVQSHLRSP